MPTHDYSGYEEEAAPDQQKLLNNLADQLAAVDNEIEELNAKLTAAEARAKQLRENDIPEMMHSLGLKEIVLANGLCVKLREEVRASFFAKNPEKREPAFRWLKENGHDGIIKNVVAVQFGKGDEEIAERFEKFAREFDAPLNLQRKRDIHGQTLLAFLREQLREGQEVPLEKFGAFVQKFAKVERK